MSASEWLAATSAVLLAMLLGGLLVALFAVVATLRELRRTVDALRQESVQLASSMQRALHDAEGEVDRVDALLTAAESVGDRLDTASKLVSKTVTNPVVKAMALGTGTKRALHRMRTGNGNGNGAERAR
jgi:uncharacterized protein YoxC